MTALTTLRLTWPREVKADAVTATLRCLATTAGTPVVLDAIGRHGRVEHQLRVPEGRASAVITLVRGTIGGLGVEPIESSPLGGFDLLIDLRLSTGRRPLRADTATVSRSLLRALAHVGRDEVVRVRWVLTDRLLPAAVPSRLPALGPESVAEALVTAPFWAPQPADADTRRALKDKQAEPGWRAIGGLAIKAASASRRQQIANATMGALRQAEAPGVHVRGRTACIRTVDRLTGHGHMRLNVIELSAICGWPTGDTADLPVVRMGSRRLPASGAVATSGRIVGESTWPGRRRLLALSPDDGLRHLHLLGPTGTGKSTLILNLVEQDMRTGRSVVVVDPKRDLVRDIIERVPEDRRGDVVVIDPSSSGHVVGLNPLAGSPGVPPELAADQLLEVFRGLYAASWGPRTNDILGAALHTLAQVGGHSLASVPLLLSNVAFRRRVVGHVNDPLGLGSFWAQYEAWSEAERVTATAPVLNKLRPFLLRTGLRRIVGQPTPSFNFRDVFTKRRIVLIDLARSRVGSDAAQLLGALALAGLWQAVQLQSDQPSNRRRIVNVYLDEFQTYLALPLALEDALTQARGLGVGFTLAHQHLKQLTPSIKAAVSANARSLIAFQLASDDAHELARDQLLLGSQDFMGLERYHFYSRLVADGQVQPWCSGRTLAPSQPMSDAAGVRRQSAERYGIAVAEVDASLAALVQPAVRPGTDDLGPRRRGKNT